MCMCVCVLCVCVCVCACVLSVCLCLCVCARVCRMQIGTAKAIKRRRDRLVDADICGN